MKLLLCSVIQWALNCQLSVLGWFNIPEECYHCYFLSRLIVRYWNAITAIGYRQLVCVTRTYAEAYPRRRSLIVLHEFSLNMTCQAMSATTLSCAHLCLYKFERENQNCLRGSRKLSFYLNVKRGWGVVYEQLYVPCIEHLILQGPAYIGLFFEQIM